MNYSILISIVFSFIIGLMVGFNSCSVSPTEKNILVKDTVFIQVPAIKIQKEKADLMVRWKTKIVQNNDIPDSIVTILTKKDSLIHLLSSKNIELQFGIDTILTNGDSLYVLCNEMNRNIFVEYKPAPRLYEIEYIAKTFEIKTNPIFSIGLGGGYGYTTVGGEMRGTVGLYAIWNIFSL